MADRDFKLLGNTGGEIPSEPSQDLLETFDNKFRKREYLVKFDCKDFNSLCPVTGQPDFARIEIQYIPDGSCIETKSLKYYLHSYRNTQAFNEEIINRICTDLAERCQPKWMRIEGAFAARGGIALTTVAEYPTLTEHEK